MCKTACIGGGNDTVLFLTFPARANREGGRMPVLFHGHRAGATERRKASCLLSFSCMFRKTEGGVRSRLTVRPGTGHGPLRSAKHFRRTPCKTEGGVRSRLTQAPDKAPRTTASAPDEVRYSTFFSASVSGILFILTMSKNETIR